MSELSIINVSLTKKDGENVIPLTSAECVTAVNSRLLTVDKSVFNIAILGAYAIGTTIPTYVDVKGNKHDEITNEKPMKAKDFYKLVQRDHSTFSRWIGALSLIIDNGDFNNFASGLYPFNYDKIYLIYPNLEKLESEEITRLDLLKMSKSTLKNMLATNNSEESTSEDESEDESEVTTSENESEVTPTSEDESEITYVDFEYNNKTYHIPTEALEAFLAPYEMENEEG